MRITTEEICYDINEVSLHGLTTGDDDQPITLCLHGWLDNAASFLPLMPYLPDRKLIALDWPGHGFSSHRSLDAHYHFIDWVYDLVQLFDITQWPAVDIVAHSMGGMVATAFAAAFPEKVKSLTLLDSIGLISDKPENTTEQLRKGLSSRLKGLSKQKNQHPSIESAVKARVAVSDMAYEQAQLIVKRGLVQQGGSYIWRADSRLRNASPYRLTVEQAKQLISDVQCPVNLVYGDKGLEMVHLGIKEFSALFSDLTVHKVSGGHHVHMEAPEQVAEKITAFWQQIAAKVP
ncbi:alpha/beta fold hydrolase [Thalassotalea euphylliae]|uniref:Alpha/beta hydrolase n=1 Tax=Thalassotalea euphylliae TaxID=1655234 RepID=A0A3E0TZP4_9GAMM|nr:alpha/beta hydrolase [Thalassotalea euphylliae]REL29900.1 alpha/beta hydrolase [Thalassotalea euphylliae]